MTAYTKAEARWKFKFPPAYRAMEKAGLFNILKDRTYINLSRAQWLAPDDLESFHIFHSFDRRPTFVPVATRHLGDAWCLNTEAGAGDEIPITFCPEDAKAGTHFAPNFAACVYRLLIEELTECRLVGAEVNKPAELPKLFAGYAKRIKPFLKPEWVQTFAELSARPFKPAATKGDYATITSAEAAKIVKRDLNWKLLDKKIKVVG